jgi:hypothetical protein
LRSHIREKLEGHEFSSVAQVLLKALAHESRSKDVRLKSDRPNMHMLDYDSSDDESKDVYAAEFTWSSNDKVNTCASLRPIHKNRQEEMKFTFDVSKCDRIIDELLKLGKIKISHVIPPLEELKKRAYCKFHHSFSHATNDCNVFRRHIQSAVNEGCLTFHDMQVNRDPFPIHALELKNPKVLIRPDQAEKAKGKNVIIGEGRIKKKVSLKVSTQVEGEASNSELPGCETLNFRLSQGVSALGGQGKNNKFVSTTGGLTGRPGGLTACSREDGNPPKLKKKVRLSFEELMAKCKKSAAQKRRNRPNGARGEKAPPRHRTQGMHQQ